MATTFTYRCVSPNPVQTTRVVSRKTVCMKVQQESSPYSNSSKNIDSDQSNVKDSDVHTTEKSYYF